MQIMCTCHLRGAHAVKGSHSTPSPKTGIIPVPAPSNVIYTNLVFTLIDFQGYTALPHVYMIGEPPDRQIYFRYTHKCQKHFCTFLHIEHWISSPLGLIYGGPQKM